jgi:hypothetical protein
VSGALCGSSSFHPYECDGPGKCPHCDRTQREGHDPSVCALCDPGYDMAPNPYWQAARQGEDAQATRERGS